MNDEKFAELVQLFEMAPLEPEGWDVALKAWVETLGGTATQFVVKSANEVRMIRCVGYSQADVCAYIDYGGTDPLISPRAHHALKAPLTTTLCDHDFVSTRDRDRFPIYRELFAPYDCDNALMSRLMVRDGAAVAVAAMRSARSGDFDHEHRRFTQALLPIPQRPLGN